MRIMLTSTAIQGKANPWAKAEFARVCRSASASRSTMHTTTNDPDEADTILFIGSSTIYHRDILASQHYKSWGPKCMVIDPQDRTIPLLPGLYCSVPTYLQTNGFYQGYPYLRVFDNASLHCSAEANHHQGRRFLYSFIGKKASNPRTRDKILKLRDDRALLLEANSGQKDGCLNYATSIFDSQFILCPRGYAASTWRIYEAMRAGRVPVIIADDWLAPCGLPWESFSVRIKESDINHIPDRLRQLEHLAETMGRSARTAWQQHLSLENSFDWICNRLNEIQLSQLEPASRLRTGRLLEALGQHQHRRAFLKEQLMSLIQSPAQGGRQQYEQNERQQAPAS
jgi:hypothetical protein